MLRELAKHLMFKKRKDPILKVRKVSDAKKKQELELHKVAITIDPDGMIPLSDIFYEGKLFKEARRIPEAIRDPIIVGLTMLHQEGFDSLEYEPKTGALTLIKNKEIFLCPLTCKSVTKEAFVELRCALVNLGDYVEMRTKAK